MGRKINVAAPIAGLVERAATGNWWVEELRDRNGREMLVSVVDDTMTPQVDTQEASDGAGPLNHRRYQVVAADPVIDAAALLATFCRDPNSFCPVTYAIFRLGEGEGLTLGAEVTVELPGPWNGPVRVTALESNCVRLETLDGHMEAGWIEMRAEDVVVNDRPAIRFTIESWARSGDQVFDVLYHRLGVGKLVQTQMWTHVLDRAVARSGGRQVGRCLVTTDVHRDRDR